MAYPKKLRERALEAVRNGHSKVEVNEMFALGVNTLRDWENLEAETGSLENRPLDRHEYKIDRKNYWITTTKIHTAQIKKLLSSLIAVFPVYAAQKKF